MRLFWLLLAFASILTTCSWSAAQDIEVDFSKPVTATDYQKAIKQGFATNYFKTDGNIDSDNLIVAKKYRTQNIQDIHNRGFRNVRLRCRPELYNDDYDTPLFKAFLNKLARVVDECIQVGVAPIISWEHHAAEANANAQARLKYIDWWTRVARKLKDRNYHLSFNLFTELGIDICRPVPGEPIGANCDSSLRRNKTAYEDWTSSVIAAIRATGEKNEKRIIILGSPEKTSVGLDYIEANMLNKPYMDEYVMVEWHEYAAGPSYEPHRPRYWSGEGNDEQKELLRNGVKRAIDFTGETGIPTYFGAWMPRDNIDGGLNQTEVVSFARFFVDLLKNDGIPWSLNVIDNYYRTNRNKWLTITQTFNFQNEDTMDGVKWNPLRMDYVLGNITEVMRQ